MTLKPFADSTGKIILAVTTNGRSKTSEKSLSPRSCGFLAGSVIHFKPLLSVKYSSLLCCKFSRKFSPFKSRLWFCSDPSTQFLFPRQPVQAQQLLCQFPFLFPPALGSTPSPSSFLRSEAAWLLFPCLSSPPRLPTSLSRVTLSSVLPMSGQERSLCSRFSPHFQRDPTAGVVPTPPAAQGGQLRSSAHRDSPAPTHLQYVRFGQLYLSL